MYKNKCSTESRPKVFDYENCRAKMKKGDFAVVEQNQGSWERNYPKFWQLRLFPYTRPFRYF